MPPQRDRWFPFREDRPNARARLVCLPFAGGSSVTYRPWMSALPSWLDVCAVELPGRGMRIGDPLLATLEDMVAAVREALLPLRELPLAIFGHSMGAHIGFELARALPVSPVRLFVSGSPAPHIAYRHPKAELPERELVAALRRLGGTSDEVLANAELMEVLMPIIRADLRADERYVGRRREPIDVPIVAFTGADDPEVTVDEVAAWQECTTKIDGGPPIVLEGGHFFLDMQTSRICGEIAARLG